MTTLLIENTLHGIQLGLLIFLLAAGLTLVFGIMDLVNLAHGSLYMIGAYLAFTFIGWSGSFILGTLMALAATLAFGMVLERIVIRPLYARNHLEQVLATFGLILFFNKLVQVIWGPAGKSIELPAWLAQRIEILPGVPYPVYRLAIMVVSLSVAAGLWYLITRTRIGMLIRAGASNRTMIGALGVDIKLLFTVVFGLGAALAGLAGVMNAPISTVFSGMGEEVLIQAFVVIVIGGIGSIRGAFIASLGLGLIDTLGRVFLTDLLKLVMMPTTASTVGPALSSMLIYLIMAAVLVWRPTGLFGRS
ncbi:MAG: branched-chain amino acid ABC transporter permease [Hyphomicrobiaceae bacterium]